MAEGAKPKLDHESKRVPEIVDFFEREHVQNKDLIDVNPASNLTKEDPLQDENEGDENCYEDVDVQSLAEARNKNFTLEDHCKIARKIDLNSNEPVLEEFAYKDGIGQEEHYKTARNVDLDGDDKPKEVASDEDNDDRQFDETLGSENVSVMEATHEEKTREEVNESSCDQDIYSAVEAEVSNIAEETKGDIYLEVKKEFDSSENQQTFDNPWYWGGVERTKVEEVLNDSLDREGIFIVRDSKRGGAESPYAISVVHSGEIFHVLVRKRDDGKMALGKFKFGEKKFSTLTQLIEFYQNNDLILYNSQGDVLGVVQLSEFPEKDF